MNKIFKGLAMIFIVAILILPVFGADLPTGSFTLTTAVTGITQIKLGGTSATNPTTPTKFIGFTTDQNSVPVNRETNTMVKKLFIMTNEVSYKINVTADALKHSGTDNYINYTLDITGATTVAPDPATTSDYTPAKATITRTGLTTAIVDYYGISVKIDKNSYDKALPGTYTGTIKFNIGAL